jgi:hypothetical protein
LLDADSSGKLILPIRILESTGPRLVLFNTKNRVEDHPIDVRAIFKFLVVDQKVDVADPIGMLPEEFTANIGAGRKLFKRLFFDLIAGKLDRDRAAANNQSWLARFVRDPRGRAVRFIRVSLTQT